LVLVGHFFWKYGYESQNSLSGMMRTLLHDILESCPDLIPIAFPTYWKAGLEEFGIKLQITAFSRFMNDHVEHVLRALLQNEEIRRTHRFCIFIDALDEYEGTARQNFAYMVKLFHEWCTSSAGSIKICVSSREDNVFEDGFRSSPRIRLQDLTRKDIERYVNDELGLAEQEARFRLIYDILEKAKGVFFWVVLVVKALNESIQDGHDIRALRKELDALPSELGDLFKRLLAEIPGHRRKNAFKIFAMMSWLSKSHCTLTLMSCLFLGDLEEDVHFAERSSLSLPEWPWHADPSTWCQSVDNEVKALKILRGYCRGMVDVEAQTSHVPSHIVFTHRSVPEFLDDPEVQQDARRLLGQFDVENAIGQVTLAELRCTNVLATHTIYLVGLLGHIYAWSCRPNATSLTMDYLTFVDALLDTIKEHQDFLREFDNPDGRYRCGPFTQDLGPSYRWFVGAEYMLVSRRVIDLVSPLYVMAVMGQVGYLKFRVAQDPHLLETESKRKLLVECLLTGLLAIPTTDPKGTFMCLAPMLEGDSVLAFDTWEVFMLHVIGYHQSRTLIGHKECWPIVKKYIGKTIEILLRKGDLAHMLGFKLVRRNSSRGAVYDFATSRTDYSPLRADSTLKPVTNTDSFVKHSIHPGRPTDDYIATGDRDMYSAQEIIHWMKFENDLEIRRAMGKCLNDGDTVGQTTVELPAGVTVATSIQPRTASSDGYLGEASDRAVREGLLEPKSAMLIPDVDESPQSQKSASLRSVARGWLIILAIVGKYHAFLADWHTTN